ncbi:MAG: hypothetical protein FWG90_13600 [Oscillospiraceae bacterium]|nr:hypothetical protein [Oscillospiraceae bacterium]
MKTARFSVKDNTNIYKLEVARSLLYFTEFDFTYFWEQCIDAGKEARKTGRLPQDAVNNARSIAAGAHPYIEACSTVFSEVVTDCIIEYICHSERITADELWLRCISAKSQYEKTVFKRVSEYKTNRAINQWANIVRLQEYARNKMAFIYAPDENKNADFSDALIRARRDYFDLACSVAANEINLPRKQLPATKVCNAASLPDATFINGRVSRALYRRLSETLGLAEDAELPESRDYSLVKDKLALDAYAYVKDMGRPNDADMLSASEALLAMPDEVFLPDSFKAAIDLEFDLACKEKLRFCKCQNCARFFVSTSSETFCDRVNRTGKTCREEYNAFFNIPQAEMPREDEIPETPAEEPKIEQSPPEQPLFKEEPPKVQGEYQERSPRTEIKIPPWRLVKPPNKGVPIPLELEKHGQRVYNALYKRLGKGMDENEFKEWSVYLSNMKRNVKSGDSTLEQLREFLIYSDELVEEVKTASRNKSARSPGYGSKQAQPEKNREAAVKTEALTQEYTEDRIKPFSPLTFSSLEDAQKAHPPAANYGYPNNSTHSEIPKEEKEAKPPVWNRLTREEAYGENN